jgi:hypothetical protein
MNFSALLALVPTQYIAYLTAAVTIAGIICTAVPPPKTTSGIWFYVYSVLNNIALNFGHAASLSAPSSAGIVGGPGATSAPLIATAVVPLVMASPAQKAVTVVPAVLPMPAPSAAPPAADVVAGAAAAAAFEAKKAAAAQPPAPGPAAPVAQPGTG